MPPVFSLLLSSAEDILLLLKHWAVGTYGGFLAKLSEVEKDLKYIVSSAALPPDRSWHDILKADD